MKESKETEKDATRQNRKGPKGMGQGKENSKVKRKDEEKGEERIKLDRGEIGNKYKRYG